MNNKQSHNKLINSASPYLLQHANNPVNWYPWGEEALQRARAEDKPLIISIGYSSCHWCHVMEKMCFEKEEIAAVMNEFFIAIKVDREERPDIDKIYMEAVQTMGLQGGWPLNVFALPDQKPFYGGTYFPPASWMQILKNISKAFVNNRDQLRNSAFEFAKALKVSETIKYGLGDAGLILSKELLKKQANQIWQQVDHKYGGLGKAPKFPNPSTWQFMLHANAHLKNKNIQDLIKITLNNMVQGGIYDQIGGGFARYSVDERWFAPHFEKMLYDNAQLVSLYSHAYQANKEALYREVVYETIDFVKREMTSAEGAFYSALDADSEGIEGKYYTWKREELKSILGTDEPFFSNFFGVTSDGNWVDGRNILYRQSLKDLDDEYLSPEGLAALRSMKKIVLQARKQKVPPELDDKVIVGWNAMMLSALIDAYLAFGEQSFLTIAQKNAKFLLENLKNGDGLYRIFMNGKADHFATLEDYAFLIRALIGLYQADFDEKWVIEADVLVRYVLENFRDSDEDLFFYTDQGAEMLIARKKEIFDDVIPASNSVMAINLYYLSIILENENYSLISDQMLGQVFTLLNGEARHLANWGILYSFKLMPPLEIAIVGQDLVKYNLEINRDFISNKTIVGTTARSDLPLLIGRGTDTGKTTVYVCFNKTCKLPVDNTTAAKHQISQIWENYN